MAPSVAHKSVADVRLAYDLSIVHLYVQNGLECATTFICNYQHY
ncbi:MAG TPA: hypothetical protein VG269_03010 [Tepidisphaeraceae bacterium]|nr:hypothetical protein [Tepidisphaeraceae bacterium]